MTDPLHLLAADRAAAHDHRDPWASLCVLATVAADGTPRARVLVLRDLDPGLGVFINASSPKQREIERCASSALVVYLASLGVQYRMDVEMAPLNPAIVHGSWALRPEIPKVMDWLYETRMAQSTPLDSRTTLLAIFEDVRRDLPGEPSAPAGAVGYRLEPMRVERLKLSGDQVHERELYERTLSGWAQSTLVP